MSGQVEDPRIPAYMIVTAAIAGRDAFIAGYGRAAAESVTRLGGRYLLRASGTELLEGNFGDGALMVISERPDKAAAKVFWNSPDYVEAKTLRAGVAGCQVLLIETASPIGAAA